MTAFTLMTPDKVQLKGELLLPEGTPKAVVQINCATGAKLGFYYPFAQYLADQGYVACLWDYRGFGKSAPQTLKGLPYKFSDFGLYDIPAVMKYLKESYPELPLLMVGHSVGGQLLGLIPDNHHIQGLLAVAVSVGHPPFMSLSYGLQTRFFFEIFSPISIALTGHVASRRFGIMEDLPRNVALEWRDWCRKPDYLFDQDFLGKTIPRGNYDSLPFPVKVIHAQDDEISNDVAVKRFWSHVKAKGEITFKKYCPKELSAKSIGHFGYFRRTFKDSIWKDMVNELEGMIAQRD